MKYNFDNVYDRSNTLSGKWDVEEGIIPMTTADMDFRVAEPIIDAMRKRLEHGIFGYNCRPASYYEAVISWMKSRYNWDVKKEWICNSPGVVGAITYCIQGFTKPGDKVLIQPPVYQQFANMIRLNDRVVVNNPLILKDGRYYMDFEDLRAKTADPDVKMMLLCSPHNPSGRIWTKEELTKIVEICVENDVLLIDDEIHCDIVLYGNKFTALGTILAESKNKFESHVIICTAASKTFNLAGLQTSNIIIPDEKLRTRYMHNLDAEHSLSTNSFGTIATENAYRYGAEWLSQLTSYIQANADHVTEYFAEHMKDAKVMKLESTYLLWIDCKAWGMNDKDLNDFFTDKAKVMINIGSIFGEAGTGYVRMNLAFPRKIIDEALVRVSTAYNEMKKNQK